MKDLFPYWKVSEHLVNNEPVVETNEDDVVEVSKKPRLFELPPPFYDKPEIRIPSQQSLNETGVFLLETETTRYIWFGSQVKRAVQANVKMLYQTPKKRDPLRRKLVHVGKCSLFQ